MRRVGRAVVVEGYFDVVALHRAGVGESVATCGTALTAEHARDLRRRTREVVLLFDGDDAGRRATRAALEALLPAGLRVRDAQLPAGDDPDTHLEREGAEALRRLLDEAPPALEAAIADACAGGLSTPWERADAVHAVAPLVALVVDPVERGEFARLLAMRTGVREEDVEAAVVAARRGGDAEEAPSPPPRQHGPEERWLRNLALALVDQPHLAQLIPRDELAEMFPDAPARELVEEIVAALGRSPDLDVGLEGEAHRLYAELVTAEREPLDEQAARRAIDETLETLRRRHHRQRRSAATRTHAQQDDADDDSLLALKTRQLRERRELSNVPPGTVRH
jgi:DNA primase